MTGKMGAVKTPSAILNEMMMKIRSTVEYEIYSDALTSNPPVFTCKVTCDGVSALGSGRSKKEAKQNAAQIMLEKIKKQTVIMQPPASKPELLSTAQALDNRVVQELKKLCSKYEYKEPVFKDLDATGPAHARNFSVQCSVSTLTEVGTAKTKKQAKIEAANKMIKNIQDTFRVDNLPSKDSTKTIKKISNSGGNGNIIPESRNKESTGEPVKLKINYKFNLSSKRKELTKDSQDLVMNLSTKVEDFQNVIKECQQNINEHTVTKVKQEFQSMLESVNIDFHHMLLQTSGPTTYMLIIQLNTSPDILEMSLGATREEAEFRTIIKVVETLNSLLK